MTTDGTEWIKFELFHRFVRSFTHAKNARRGGGGGNMQKNWTKDRIETKHKSTALSVRRLPGTGTTATPTETTSF